MFTPERPLTAKEIRTLLESYVQMSPSPDYAILLCGKWGCGKTWLIRDIFKSPTNSITPPSEAEGTTSAPEVIYVSLFEKATLSEVSKDVFIQLHPVLSNKYLNSILKSLDVNIPASKQLNISINLGDILKCFSSIESSDNKEFLFIFDDFERSKIKPILLLGYLNRLLLTKKARIVCIANIEEIDDKDFLEKYNEKVFGAKIEFNGASFNDILERNSNFLPNGDTFKRSIEQTWDDYEQYHNRNCRTLIRLLNALNNFNKKMDEKIDPEIRDQLLVSLFNRKVQALNTKEKIAQGFYHTNLPILQEETWQDVCANIINAPDIVRDVHAYNERTNNPPLWLKLWSYEELSNDTELRKLEDEALKYLNGSENLRLGDILHLSTTLFDMYHNQCCFTTSEAIRAATTNALTTLKSKSPQEFSGFIKSSFTGSLPDYVYGYGFRGNKSPDFKITQQDVRKFYLEIEEAKWASESAAFLRNHGLLPTLHLLKEKKNQTLDKDLEKIFSLGSLSCSEVAEKLLDDNSTFNAKMKSCDLILELVTKDSKDKKWRNSLIEELEHKLLSLSSKITKFRIDSLLRRLRNAH